MATFFETWIKVGGEKIIEHMWAAWANGKKDDYWKDERSFCFSNEAGFNEDAAVGCREDSLHTR
jgi:hypothetical protein